MGVCLLSCKLLYRYFLFWVLERNKKTPQIHSYLPLFCVMGCCKIKSKLTILLEYLQWGKWDILAVWTLSSLRLQRIPRVIFVFSAVLAKSWWNRNLGGVRILQSYMQLKKNPPRTELGQWRKNLHPEVPRRACEHCIVTFAVYYYHWIAWPQR